jgi:DNA mismatch endonuclease, patch repair protein
MSRVAAKDTSPEMRVRQASHALGLRYRIHQRDLPGTPDLVFRKHRTVLFVHGCFWHRHANCKKATLPKSRVRYWRDKFDRNVERDKKTQTDLKALGWRVVVIWECETKNGQKLLRRISKIFNLRPTGGPRHPRREAGDVALDPTWEQRGELICERAYQFRRGGKATKRLR